jgi:hypothetical protein
MIVKDSPVYNRLMKELGEVGETGLDIVEAYILQVGCTSVEIIGESDRNSRYPLTDIEKAKSTSKEIDLTDFFERMSAALKKSSNVFSLEASLDDRKSNLTRLIRGGRLPGGLRFSMDVKIPKRAMHLAVINEIMASETVEEFNVVHDGSIFIAYAPLLEYPVYVTFGSEYRELLSDNIEVKGGWTIGTIGPSPIHPKIYLVRGTGTEPEQEKRLRLYRKSDNILLVADQNWLTLKDLAWRILYELAFPLREFYSGMILVGRDVKYHVEISNRLGDFEKTLRDLYAVPVWRFFKARQMARVARRDLCEIHIKLLESQSESLRLARVRSEIHSFLELSPILHLVEDYFEDHLQGRYPIPDSIDMVLSHFGEELRTFENSYSTIDAALAGGLIGAAAAAIGLLAFL